jgi:hypothetical protein
MMLHILMQELASAEYMLPDNISVFMQMADRQLDVCASRGKGLRPGGRYPEETMGRK